MQKMRCGRASGQCAGRRRWCDARRSRRLLIPCLLALASPRDAFSSHLFFSGPAKSAMHVQALSFRVQCRISSIRTKTDARSCAKLFLAHENPKFPEKNPCTTVTRRWIYSPSSSPSPRFADHRFPRPLHRNVAADNRLQRQALICEDLTNSTICPSPNPLDSTLDSPSTSDRSALPRRLGTTSSSACGLNCCNHVVAIATNPYCGSL